MPGHREKIKEAPKRQRKQANVCIQGLEGLKDAEEKGSSEIAYII
jgi:hypothetical protein